MSNSGNGSDFDPKGRDELDPRFPVEGAVVGIDDYNGDVVIYSGKGVASYSRKAWWPGIWFDKSSMLQFTAVRDPTKIREYLKAANNALIESLEKE